MNRYELLLGKRLKLRIRISTIVEYLRSIGLKWVRKNQYRFTNYRWFRKWWGGKWIQWSTEFGVIWQTAKEKAPGCCRGKLREEEWTD